MIANIRLDKRTKTIKVVNRRYNVRLTHTRGQDIRLSHTGKRGPVGPASTVPGPVGPTGVSTFVRSHHGSDQGVARPNALYVEWVGNVAPNNATVQDTWIKLPT